MKNINVGFTYATCSYISCYISWYFAAAKKKYFTMFRILQQFDEMWNSSITAIRYITSAQ